MSMLKRTIIIAPRIPSDGGQSFIHSRMHPSKSGLCETPIQQRPAGFKAWLKGVPAIWEHGQTRAKAERQMQITAKADGWAIGEVIQQQEPV